MALVDGVWVSVMKAADLREGDLFIWDGDFNEDYPGEQAETLKQIVEMLKDPSSRSNTAIVSIDEYPEEGMIGIWTAAWGTDLYNDDVVYVITRRLNPGFC